MRTHLSTSKRVYLSCCLGEHFQRRNGLHALKGERTMATAKAGVTAIVAAHEWVQVMNPDGVRSGNKHFSFEDTCSIAEGGTMTVEAVDRDRLLVSYTTPNNETAYGAACPSGTLFFVPVNRFLSSDARYDRKSQELGVVRHTCELDVRFLCSALPRRMRYSAALLATPLPTTRVVWPPPRPTGWW
jgi:hypothetical protein